VHPVTGFHVASVHSISDFCAMVASIFFVILPAFATVRNPPLSRSLGSGRICFRLNSPGVIANVNYGEAHSSAKRGVQGQLRADRVGQAFN
jgi:hypothetical protein